MIPTRKHSPRLTALPMLLCLPAVNGNGVVSQEAKLEGSQADYMDSFGYSVGVSGDSAVIGSLELSFPDFTPGSAYVFVRDAQGVWSEQARLTPSDGLIDPPTSFGWRVAIEGDRVLVGAPGSATGGAAYVYERTPLGWTETQKLEPATPVIPGRFGAGGLALEGDLVAVGAPGNVTTTIQGSASIFEQALLGWAETSSVSASDGHVGDRFGLAIASGDGHVFVGAPRHDAGIVDHGAVYVFGKVGNGWVEQAKIELTDAAANDRFGGALVYADGLLYAGVAARESVYAFAQTPLGWFATGLIRASDGVPGDGFGSALDADGDRLVVSAPGRGVAYAFERSGSTWIQRAAFTGDDVDPIDQYGTAIGVSGTRVVVTADWGDGLASLSGAAYAFHWAEPAASTLFCAGDGSAAACPCGNESNSGSGAGCLNSTGAGALLDVFGSTSAGADDLVFTSTGLPATIPALLYTGTESIAGGMGTPFGDGLRCVGGDVVRITVATSDVAGCATWGPDLASIGLWAGGDTRQFQVWYRDPNGGPCGAGFNLSAARSILFAP